MPKKNWTKKDERKYEAILASCKVERPRGKKRTAATCKRIAAATVNRDKKGGFMGLRGTPEEHRARITQLREYLAELQEYGDPKESAPLISGALYEEEAWGEGRVPAGWPKAPGGRPYWTRGLGAITQSDVDKTTRGIRAMREDWMQTGSREWQWAREDVAKAEAAAAQCNPEPWYVRNALDYLASALQSYTAADVYDGMIGGGSSSSSGVPAQIRGEIISLGETLALAMSHCKR